MTAIARRAAHAPTPAAATPAVAVRGLTKRFGATVAVDRVSFELPAAELLTVVGPSGCGKSTLLRLIAGLVPADEGEIRLGGTIVTDRRVRVPPERRNVAIVFQEPALFPHVTVAENVAFGLDGRPADEARRRTEAMLALVGLAAHGRRYPHELSGGERQRVALARALAPAPLLLLLDEPFANLDRSLRVELRDAVAAVLRATGTPAIVVTHEQEDALTLGDRIAVMRAGRIEDAGPPEEVFHAPANRFVATFLGEADFLPIRGRADGVLLTEAGRCPAPRGAVPPGAEVMVRPHEVVLRADPAGNGRVVASEFQGGFVLYRVELDSGARLSSHQPHTVTLPLGARVAVELDHGHEAAVLPVDRG